MSPPHLCLQIGDGMALCRVVRADTMFCGRVIDIVGERAPRGGANMAYGCMLEMYR